MGPSAEIKQSLHCAETQEVDQHFKEHNIDNCCWASQCSCQLISYDEIKGLSCLLWSPSTIALKSQAVVQRFDLTPSCASALTRIRSMPNELSVHYSDHYPGAQSRRSLCWEWLWGHLPGELPYKTSGSLLPDKVRSSLVPSARMLQHFSILSLSSALAQRN